MLFPGMRYTRHLTRAGGLGLQGIGKRQCLTTVPAALNLLLLLSSTYNSPRQELVPEGSPFLQAEEDTPCKCKTQTPSQGASATDPWLTAPAKIPKFIPARAPHCPRPHRRRDQQAHQAITDVPLAVKPLHCPPPPQGGNIWDPRQIAPLLSPQDLHGRAGQLGVGPGTLWEGFCSAPGRSQQLPPCKHEQSPDEIHVQALLGIREPRHIPTGAPNAAETPAAAPAETKSLFSVSLRKYSKI